MASVRLYLRQDKTSAGKTRSKEDLFCVYLRVALDAKQSGYFSTGFWTKEEDFNKDLQRFKARKNLTIRRVVNGQDQLHSVSDANKTLESDFVGRANTIIRGYANTGTMWTLERFRKDFLGEGAKPSTDKFYGYAMSVYNEQVTNGKIKTAMFLEDALNALEKYCPGIKKKALIDIDSNFIKGFIKWGVDNNHKKNTIFCRVSRVRFVLNCAIQDNDCPYNISNYPFGKGGNKVQIASYKETQTKTENFLQAEQLKQLATTTFRRKTHEYAKHIFLFCFYCRGINLKDAAFLTDRNIKTESYEMPDGTVQKKKTIVYTRSKTHKELHPIIINDQIQTELDWFTKYKEDNGIKTKYLLPIIRKNIQGQKLVDYYCGARDRYNIYLKEMANILGFPENKLNIASYTSRHSFAMYVYEEKQAGIEAVSELLGHSELKTTKNYLERFKPTKLASIADIDLTD